MCGWLFFCCLFSVVVDSYKSLKVPIGANIVCNLPEWWERGQNAMLASVGQQKLGKVKIHWRERPGLLIREIMSLEK